MMPFLCSSFLNVSTELDALGDDLAFDEDTSYLDDAERAPAAPDTELTEPSATKVTVVYYGDCFLFYSEKLRNVHGC